MKQTSTLKRSTILILPAILFLACSPDKGKENTEAAAPLEATYSTDSVFRKQITAFYEAYISVKDALVNSDSISTASTIQSLRPAFSKIQPSDLSEGAKAEWDSRSAALESAISAIEKNTGLGAQRESFSILSEEAYRLVKAFGLNGTDTYYAFCPMALNDKGAYWLSREKEIRNPYFGASMLNCGAVRELRH